MSSVKVTVLYFGPAREAAGRKEEELVLAPPAKIEQAISQAIDAHPRLSELKETIKLLINGQWAAVKRGIEGWGPSHSTAAGRRRLDESDLRSPFETKALKQYSWFRRHHASHCDWENAVCL